MSKRARSHSHAHAVAHLPSVPPKARMEENFLFLRKFFRHGTRIASGSFDNTVQVWDAKTGKRLLTYRGHTNTVFSVAWSPDGTRIASGSDDSTVQVWDAKTGKRLLTYYGDSNPVLAVAWSNEYWALEQDEPDANEIAPEQLSLTGAAA